MKQDRPKISDVARLAGVSTATVSRVISNPGLVSEDTRATVQEAIRASGYRLNQAARNLRHRRTGGIVALVPNLANPFFSQILSGIASRQPLPASLAGTYGTFTFNATTGVWGYALDSTKDLVQAL